MLGLPLDSFVILIGLPALIVATMFYYCRQIRKGRHD